MTFDLKILGGTVLDGTGAQGFRANVGITHGHIVEIGACDGPARRTIDADGALVTPGFTDLHTHYDGQVSWDADLAPSSLHGVTTCVMGNCGVGFAPVRARSTAVARADGRRRGHPRRRARRGHRLALGVLPRVVKMLAHDTARYMGFDDRGTIALGQKGDLNVIDFDRLRLTRPSLVADLPAGGKRLLQRAEGYLATIVSGEVVVDHGSLTGARPGRLVRLHS